MIRVSEIFSLAREIAKNSVEGVTRTIWFAKMTNYVPGSGSDPVIPDSFGGNPGYRRVEAIRTSYVREYRYRDSLVISAYRYVFAGNPPDWNDKVIDGNEERTILSISRDPTNSLTFLITTA